MNTVYDDLIYDAALRYAVPFDWIKAIIGTESSFNPWAIREEPKIGDASRGLMQILLRTARGLGYTGEPEGLFDPALNIDLGTRLLRQLIDRYGSGSFERIYSAYNSGRADAYLTSRQVETNVQRALDWLASVRAAVAGAAQEAAPVVPFLVAGAAWLLLRKRR